ncbi:hypothetical protein ACIPV2_01250 [Microbacterium sp. NPDC089987]|uniref:hypothetical protein n=1 Tax=Microbacterium sp. NPDC089987 TaxID=3364202 RepID=UPI003825C8BB
MAYTESVNKETSFRLGFRDANDALMAQNTELTGQAAHGFITTLIVAAMNAGRIAQWDLYHSLDKGDGVLVDEWSAMLHLMLPRLEAVMTERSIKMQPDAVNADTPVGSGPSGTTKTRTTGCQMCREHRRDAPCHPRRRRPHGRDARQESARPGRAASPERRPRARPQPPLDLALCLKFIDAEPHAGDEDDVWEAVPADGVLIAAEATIEPGWDWHHA